MGRLFAGTPWDRPPTCERCGRPESECTCPPIVPEPKVIPPGGQTAQLRIEKRNGRVVTLVAGLDPGGTNLNALAADLKARCFAGGTVKKGVIELQGDHRDTAESILREIGFRIRRG